MSAGPTGGFPPRRNCIPVVPASGRINPTAGQDGGIEKRRPPRCARNRRIAPGGAVVAGTRRCGMHALPWPVSVVATMRSHTLMILSSLPARRYRRTLWPRCLDPCLTRFRRFGPEIADFRGSDRRKPLENKGPSVGASKVVPFSFRDSYLVPAPKMVILAALPAKFRVGPTLRGLRSLRFQGIPADS